MADQEGEQDTGAPPIDRPFTARLLDVVVYAPIGAVETLRQAAPRLVVDGRARIEPRVRTARWVGEMAVTVARQQLARRWDDLWRASAPPTGGGEGATVAPAGRVSRVAGIDEVPLAERPSEPFHGYDAVPASELVGLLGRLTHGELALVRDYETATRGRRTVLATVDELLETP